MLELKDIKDDHDRAYINGQTVREDRADDLLFYWVTQWDDNLITDSTLEYRGEFNIIRKAGRQILGDLRANPVQVDFKPDEDNEEESADLMDGMYRTSTRKNTSIESFDNAKGEAVVCGTGAWELFTTYKNNKAGDRTQVVSRRPIAEANNCVFWDPDSELMDKSDALFCSYIKGYTEEGYRKFAAELTGRDPEDIDINSFAYPEQTWSFVWITDQKDVFVTNFYHREKVTEKVVVVADPFGVENVVSGDDMDDQMEALLDAGYTVVTEREVEKFQVRKYIASGSEILKSYIIPGGKIPVISTYGERAWVEGVEWYEGCTNLAKDPQRLRNFQMSYLAGSVATAPSNKPIYFPEQIHGFEYMYEEAGSDDHYQYKLQNRYDANGVELPLGPIGQSPDYQLSPSLMAAIQLSREAVEDVANPGLPQDIADTDLSGKAVMALQQRLDQQSIVYQQNFKHAIRRDGEVFACMVSEICDTPRREMLTNPDGTTHYEQLMVPCMDPRTGLPIMKNDITNIEYEVWADIGPAYDSLKDQTVEQLTLLINTIPQGDPLRNILTFKLLRLMPGVDFEDVRDYANRQLLILGVKEPEDEEEMMVLQQAQQQQEKPDPIMVAAQAEILKGQAAQMREQRQAMKDQADAINNQRKTEIDGFEAETDRMDTMIDAQQAGASIQQTEIESFGKQLDNAAKVVQARRESMAPMTILFRGQVNDIPIDRQNR